MTVDMSECLLNELVAYADNDNVVCVSNDVLKAIKNILYAALLSFADP